MSRESSDLDIRATLVGESAAAIQVEDPKTKKRWWIPRSQIAYLRKDKADTGTNVVFTLPEWLIDSKQCWEIVT